MVHNKLTQQIINDMRPTLTITEGGYQLNAYANGVAAEGKGYLIETAIMNLMHDYNGNQSSKLPENAQEV